MIRVAQAVWCLAREWTTGPSRFDAWHRQEIFPVACLQTCSGVHPDSCTMGTGGPFPGGKSQPGRKPDHSPQSSAEFVNE
jgi:hypothetical protein